MNPYWPAAGPPAAAAAAAAAPAAAGHPAAPWRAQAQLFGEGNLAAAPN
jgi:hypothetical protein